MEILKYLRTTVTNQNDIYECHTSRRISGNGCCHSVHNLSSPRLITKEMTIKICYLALRCRDSQWYSAGLWVGWSGVRVAAGAGKFSLHHGVKTDTRAHPASCPMDTKRSFPGGKAAGEWSWPFTFIYCRWEEWLEPYFHPPLRLHGMVLS